MAVATSSMSSLHLPPTFPTLSLLHSSTSFVLLFFPLFLGFFDLGLVMADGDWVTMGRPRMKDLWKPSLVEDEASRLLEVRFSGPAKHWIDAIPIGNGRLGAIPIGRRRCTDLATEKHTPCELCSLQS
ncbi:Alpha-L-fucosidase 2 [Camellia lanceoleosa]|nr:Alpha-L-fucosidase 2 [Camellia lanceoleosa]